MEASIAARQRLLRDSARETDLESYLYTLQADRGKALASWCDTGFGPPDLCRKTSTPAAQSAQSGPPFPLSGPQQRQTQAVAQPDPAELARDQEHKDVGSKKSPPPILLEVGGDSRELRGVLLFQTGPEPIWAGKHLADGTIVESLTYEGARIRTTDGRAALIPNLNSSSLRH